jgi:hypothetical protein
VIRHARIGRVGAIGILFALTAAALVWAAPGTAQNSPAPAHTLTVSTSVFDPDPSAPGTAPGTIVTGIAGRRCDASCSYSLPVGSRVQLIAHAFPGSVLREWADPALCAEFPNAEETCTVTIASTDIAVTAVFVQGDQTLKVQSPGNLAITSTPPGISCADGLKPDSRCAASFPAGTKVRLTATPTVPGVHVLRWSTWDCAPKASFCDVTIDGHREVSVFVSPFLIRVEKSGDASATLTYNPGGFTCGPGCPALNVRVTGSAHQVSVQTSGGAQSFDGWSGDCEKEGLPDVCSFLAYQGQDLVATYGPQTLAMLLSRPQRIQAFGLKDLVLSKTGPGSVGILRQGGEELCAKRSCRYHVPTSTNVTLVARPTRGASFRWAAGLCPNRLRCTVSAELIDTVRGVFK